MPTIDDIRDKVRRVTGRYEDTQLTDSQIDVYINTTYKYDLPEHFQTLKLQVPYVFTTIPNVDTYNFPFNDYIFVNQPAFASGYRMRWFQDKGMFYANWPKPGQLQQIDVGNGTVGPYTGSGGGIPGVPFLRAQINAAGQVQESNVIFSAAKSGLTLVAQDVSYIGDVGKLGGPQVAIGSFVNYVTGQFSLEFTTSVPNNVPIYVQVIPYGAGRPIDVLFNNQQFTIRPVPDKVYQIEFQAYKSPTSMLAGQSPELDDWWQFLAYGAACKVYADFPDAEGMAYAQQLFQEQKELVQRRTLKQLGTQRAQTLFSVPSRSLNPALNLPYNV